MDPWFHQCRLVVRLVAITLGFTGFCAQKLLLACILAMETTLVDGLQSIGLLDNKAITQFVVEESIFIIWVSTFVFAHTNFFRPCHSIS